MQLYNTLTGQVEQVSPRDGRIGMYVCGVTPYDTTHTGHAFTYLVFDVLARYLRSTGVDVTYVQNVTDIDDDILRKAKELGIDWQELGNREIARFLEDLDELNFVPFDHYVRATDHIAEVITITEKLVKAGVAYESNGSAYFNVAADANFGKLSKIPRAEMLPIANERGNVPDDPNKRDPLDFVLWQAAADGEPSWESPFGPGRPGWHVECSAMATKYLGNTIDIHGGGADLLFPHHESEIAQAENATGEQPFVRHWMHVAMVEYQGEKMSKSLGNLVLVRDVLTTYHPDALRLYLLSHHYRTNWEYIDEEIEEWAQVAADFREALDFPAFGPDEVVDVIPFREHFRNAMEEDLNIPEAVNALKDIASAILQAPEEDDIGDAQNALRDLSDILGLSLSE